MYKKLRQDEITVVFLKCLKNDIEKKKKSVSGGEQFFFCLCDWSNRQLFTSEKEQ